MAWIELHQSVWTHRKTMALAAALDIDELYAAAHMAKLWCWCLDNAPSGDLSTLPARSIARAAEWRGDATAFADALQTSGYVDPDGGLHDWQDYAGRLIEQREAERQRSRNRRQAVREASSNSTATDRRTTGGRPEVGQQTTVGTVPNRTEPNQGQPSLRSGSPRAAAAAPTTPPPAAPSVNPDPAPDPDPDPADALPEAEPCEDTPQTVATAAYDVMLAAGCRPASQRWVGTAIGRIKQLNPDARRDVVEAVRWAVQPGQPGHIAAWLTKADFPQLLAAWWRFSETAAARASPGQGAAAVASVFAAAAANKARRQGVAT